MQAQSGVELSVLGSWSLPKEGQEGMESFLRDLSTIFPQQRWLQIRRQIGKMGFTCDVLNRDQSKMLKLIFTAFTEICAVSVKDGMSNIKCFSSLVYKMFMFLNLSFSRPDGRAAKDEAKKEKEGENEKSDSDEKDEEKVIFVHYEQRKVMLSQLHPIENGVPDTAAGAPSELRQVKVFLVCL